MGFLGEGRIMLNVMKILAMIVSEAAFITSLLGLRTLSEEELPLKNVILGLIIVNISVTLALYVAILK